MLCAGLTVYSPLTNAKVGPRSRVGVVALGGLGHFAVMFAAAMGAELPSYLTARARKQTQKSWVPSTLWKLERVGGQIRWAAHWT